MYLMYKVKSIKFQPKTRGIFESCDGTKLSIGDIYYLEFLFYTDNNQEVFRNPSEIEITIAKKHGILFKQAIFP